MPKAATSKVESHHGGEPHNEPRAQASMIESKREKYLVAQPLSAYFWPFETPTRLWHSLWVRDAPELPTGDDPFWRWALSGRESENLKRYPWWVTLELRADDNALSQRQQRAVEIVRYSRLAIQLIAPVGCDESTIVVTGQKSVNTVHPPPMTSTPWGRISGYENIALADIRRVVRGVNAVFRFRVPRLINPLQFLELGFGASNPYIGTFLWVSGLDAILMAGNSKNFRERLINVFGEKTFVLPRVEPSGQPRYRIGEIAAELYDLRSAIAHGQLVPKKFLEQVGLQDMYGKEISTYLPRVQYFQVMRECALFLLIQLLRKIFLEDRVGMVNDTSLWRARLEHPF